VRRIIRTSNRASASCSVRSSAAVSAALSAAILVGTAAAEAADLSAPMPVKAAPFVPSPVFNWSGWYAGVNGGYGWGHDDPGAIIDPAGVPMLPDDTASTGLSAIVLDRTNPKGGLFGGQFGYNFQSDRAVFGFEADIDWSGLKGTSSASVAFPVSLGGDDGSFLGTASLESRLDWFGTVRGRLGYAFDRFLPYVTGGLAYGEIKRTLAVSGTTFDTGTATPIPLGQTSAAASTSSVHVGWALGAGADFAVTDHVVLRAEYLHLNLDGNGSGPSIAFGSLPDHGMSVDLVRAAASYKF